MMVLSQLLSTLLTSVFFKEILATLPHLEIFLTSANNLQGSFLFSFNSWENDARKEKEKGWMYVMLSWVQNPIELILNMGTWYRLHVSLKNDLQSSPSYQFLIF